MLNTQTNYRVSRLARVVARAVARVGWGKETSIYQKETKARGQRA
jgi:hypothetical protein